MKKFFKKPLCFVLGHDWKEVRIIPTGDQYFYVCEYIMKLKNEGRIGYQCKRCAAFKDETPEY